MNVADGVRAGKDEDFWAAILRRAAVVLGSEGQIHDLGAHRAIEDDDTLANSVKILARLCHVPSTLPNCAATAIRECTRPAAYAVSDTLTPRHVSNKCDPALRHVARLRMQSREEPASLIACDRGETRMAGEQTWHYRRVQSRTYPLARRW